MKHTFVLIDNLIILLKDVPKTLDSEDDKTAARKIVAKIRDYVDSLKKLIDNHKTEKYLRRLHQSHMSEVLGWADQVEDLFRKFEQLLNYVESDANDMEQTIEGEPEKWLSKVSDTAYGMVLTGLHDEVEEMKRFRNIAIFQEHELREIIEAEEHIAEILE